MTALGRILIVDDEAPVLDVLSEYFAAQGYEIDTAGNGEEALAALRARCPDLVLLDVRMPGIDGVETLKRLRGLGGDLPVVMVTANEDVALARETLALGAFDYVAKPFDFTHLDRVVAAGLLRSGRPGRRPGDAAVDGDAWRRLVRTVFQAARHMSEPARASLGARLEEAALAAARAAARGCGGEAGQHLGEITLLLGIAVDLGDLADIDRTAIESTLSPARRTLPAPG